MGTDRKHAAPARRGTGSETKGQAKREPVAPVDAPAAAEDTPTTIVRRFRRGRWTVTAVPV